VTRDEAQRRGLTEDAVREEVHDVRSRIEKVASAARDAARDEAGDRGQRALRRALHV
jgi:hypothetical protein